MKTEKQKYLDWFKREQKNGLVYINVFPNSEFSFETGFEPLKCTEEELYGELNRMLLAKDLPDKEVLGKYSIL